MEIQSGSLKDEQVESKTTEQAGTILQCDSCPFLTLCQTRYGNHMSSLHANNSTLSPLICPGCPNQFVTKISLESHLINDHMVESSEIEHMLHLIDPLAVRPPKQSRIYIKSVDVLRNPDLAFTEEHTPVACNGDHYQSLPDSTPTPISVQMPNATDTEEILQTPGPRQKIYLKNVNELQQPPPPMFDADFDQFPVQTMPLPPQRSFPIPTPPLITTPAPPDPPVTMPIEEPPPLIFNAEEVPKTKIYIRNVKTLIGPDVTTEPAPVSTSYLRLQPVDCLDIDEEVQSLPPQRNDIVILDEMPSLNEDIFAVNGSAVLDLIPSEEFSNMESLKGIVDGQGSNFMFMYRTEEDCDTLAKDCFYYNTSQDFEMCRMEATDTLTDTLTPPKNDEEAQSTPPNDLADNVIDLNDSPVTVLPRMPRIYVSSHLSDPVHPSPAAVEPSDLVAKGAESSKSRGRPKGGRNYTRDLYPFQCPQLNCPRRFRLEGSLEYHRKCHVVNDQGEGSGIVCPECGVKDFNKWDPLHSHLWRQHSIDMELYACELCNFKTPSLSSLNNTHRRTHSDEKKFNCELCSSAFKNRKQLKNHRRHHRLSEAKKTGGLVPERLKKVFKCPSCDMELAQLASLKRHIQKVHRSKRATEVEGVVPSREAINTDTEQKEFKCNECPYRTSHRNSAKRHQLIHTGHRPYKCPVCDYTCIQSNSFRVINSCSFQAMGKLNGSSQSLQSHLEKSHPATARELIFKCSLCSFATINKQQMTLHRMAKHDPLEIEKEPVSLET